MKKAVFLICILWYFNPVVLQAAAPTQEIDSAYKASVMMQMKKHSDTLRNSFNQNKRFAANDSFIESLKLFLEFEDAFDIELDSINTVAFIRSDDRKVRAITWLVADNSGNYKSFGVIQSQFQKKQTEHVWLKERVVTNKKELENREYSDQEWPGGLIYEIRKHKMKKHDSYIILSFHGLGPRTNRKILDIMYYDEESGWVFGMPVFMRKKKDMDPDYRVVFEYSDQASMTLRFDEKEPIIVFDHLVSPIGNVVESPEFLVPDGTYGCYVIKRKGMFERLEDFGTYIKWDEAQND